MYSAMDSAVVTPVEPCSLATTAVGDQCNHEVSNVAAAVVRDQCDQITTDTMVLNAAVVAAAAISV